MEFYEVFNYLHIPKRDDLTAEISRKLPIPNKTVIKKYAKAIIERLNNVENEILEYVEIMFNEFSMKRQYDNRAHKEKSEE